MQEDAERKMILMQVNERKQDYFWVQQAVLVDMLVAWCQN
jgi:hypothetical protein